MSSEHPTPQQPENRGLAPCKSSESIQGDAPGPGAQLAPHSAHAAVPTPAQHNGHEDNIAGDFTLPLDEWIQKLKEPNITVTIGPRSAVMWAAPGSPGSRSECPLPEPDTAGGVTSLAPAEQGAGGGAAVAGVGEAKQAQPARDSVTEANGDEAGVRTVTAGNASDASGGAGKGSEGSATVGFGREVAFQRHPGDADTPAGNSNVDEGVDNDGFVDEERGFAAPALPFLSDEAVQSNYRVVREARAVMALNKAERERRRDNERSAGTVKDYEGDVRMLAVRGKALEDQVSASAICAGLAYYAPKKNSFYKLKSSALWDARRRVEALLAEQDQRQRNQPKSLAWGRSIDALRLALQELEQIQALGRDDALALMDAVSQPVESKKLVLKRANQDWRELFFAETAKSAQYRSACFLMAACGMRPAELAKGVLVQRLGSKVGVRIEGAKVTQKSGQEWRTLFIDAGRFPDWFLPELGETPRKYSAPSGPMRSYLHRLSPKVLTKKWKGEQLSLSPYVLRHCIATDMYQDGWSTAEIAAVLGERVADTVRHYGLRTRGAKWREPEVMLVRGKVLTAVPVRTRDPSFLVQKAAVRASLKKAPKGPPGKGRAP